VAGLLDHTFRYWMTVEYLRHSMAD
jgi:hypothetical protein